MTLSSQPTKSALRLTTAPLRVLPSAPVTLAPCHVRPSVARPIMLRYRNVLVRTLWSVLYALPLVLGYSIPPSPVCPDPGLTAAGLPLQLPKTKCGRAEGLPGPAASLANV